jgi:O-antigen/teichoic acid export membrane protein
MPTGLKKLAVNFISILSANFISRLVAFIYFTLLARYLGPADTGIYGYLFIFISLGNIFGDFGINRMLIRDVARSPLLAQNYLDQILTLRFFLSLLAGLVIYGLIWIIPHERNVFSLAPIALVSILPFSLALTFDGVLKARERMRQSAISTIGFESAKLILLFLVIYLNWKLAGILWMLVVAFLFYNVWLIFFINKEGLSLRFQGSIQSWKYILTTSLPFALLAILEILHGRLDLFLLKNLLHDDVSTGNYFVAYRMMDVFLILPAAANVVLLPRFSRHFITGPDRIRYGYHTMLKLLSIVGLITSLLVFLLGNFAITTLFGDKYSYAVPILKVLTISLFFFFMHYANVTFLAASYLQWQIIILGTVQVSINLVMNLILIPRHGAIGAAWANNISTAVAFIVFSLFINFQFKKMLRRDNETS